MATTRAERAELMIDAKKNSRSAWV